MSKLSRREVLSGLASGTLALSGGPLVSSKGTDVVKLFADKSEYLFEPGLNYLNTAALGPTPRGLLDKVFKAWYELELDPVMKSFGDG